MLQVAPHLPAAHTGWPWAGVGHTLLQEPQWVALVATSTHVDTHRVPLHVDAQCGVPVEESQIEDVPEQAVAHAPQCSGTLRAVSQPSVGSPLQSP
jgi:hypothetical protein